MSTRVGNITLQVDSDDLMVRPQAEASDEASDGRCSVFVDGSGARLQLSGTYDALRALANGIAAATDAVEQRKLTAALPADASF